MSTEVPVKKTQQRLIISAIALLFFMPFAASWFIYYFTDMGRGDAARSYGELINPPAIIADTKLSGPADDVIHRLHGKWNLVYMSSTDCNQSCRLRLADMEGIRLALGEDAARLQLLLATTAVANVAVLHELLQSRGDTRVLIFQPVEATADPGKMEPGNLYLIDPLGNLMMKYSASSNAEGIISDLKRLLRYSRIG